MTIDSKPAQIPLLVMGVVSVASDVYILILPLPILLKFHVNWKRKIGLCLIFAAAIMYVYPCRVLSRHADLDSGIVSSCFVLYFRIILWQYKTLDSTWNVGASYLTV
jgi:hypothetical protein